LHLEVARFGIRVLDVQPGLTTSDCGAKMKQAGGMRPDNPYAAMRESAARAYPRMSSEVLSPKTVAEVLVAQLKKGSGPLRLRIGEDAHRMVAAIRAGDEAFERYLVPELGFDWHPIHLQ